MMKLCLVLALAAVSTVNAGLFGNKCTAVPRTACALAYDDENCGGWKLEVPQGELNFVWWSPVWYWYRNDIETVSVRPGCTFTAFDDTNYHGKSITIRNNGNSDKHVNLGDDRAYKDLDEKIQSIQCSCR
eukprot:TRINITY_DN15176_c0_g1_i1.p1 TRINITY_DN15176_c0_g1~~TRINITY_DN15176_c0_g1_i1.p1  ORF type:complete len:139 (+),score=29.54 TRINITY_DN15176_c0_g1_i1:30-419(+)